MEFRIIDANLNRLNEALRVIEDVNRLKLNNKSLTSKIKRIRHSIQKFSKKYYFNLLESRDTKKDLGKFLNFKSEFKRKDIKDVLAANFKRIEESCRVLEEILKIDEPEYSAIFKEIRFKTYYIEKKTILEIIKSEK